MGDSARQSLQQSLHPTTFHICRICCDALQAFCPPPCQCTAAGLAVHAMLLAVLALAAGSHASRSRGTVAPFSLVINLGHRADRLAAFRAIYYSSDFAAVPLERLESVDGRAADWSMLLDGPALQRLATVQRTGVRASHEELTPGAIGCYLSHMEAWRRVASSGAPYAFVFEDDAVVDPHALAAFEAARQQAPPGWDILLLGCSGGRASALSLNLTRVDDFLGLWAYAISADAARALHATMLPLSQQVDHEVTGRIKAGLLRIYAVQPFAAQHSWDQGTDIQLPVNEEADAAHLVREDEVTH